ncbi:MAG TPA: enoyl-CoA hydratase [Steroidobacteraceae bacterium]|nr:enoyl-CoA hydratase [Steroidobacteraceae bacterium]
MSEVLLEKRGRVAVVTLNRPESLNGFTTSLRVELRRALEAVATEDSVRAVVLTGAGRGFSAGADLKGNPMMSGPAVERELNEEYGPCLRLIANMPKPVVAALNGFATGIGGSFALICDLVVMGEGAFFQVPFARLGLVPDGGMTYLLTERLGHRRAFELAIGGERVPAARCLEWGLANRVVPDERVLGEALSWAEQLCDAAPIALGYMKQLLRRSPGLGYEATIREEARLQAPCIDSQDFREGVIAFLQKRSPRFQGR